MSKMIKLFIGAVMLFGLAACDTSTWFDGKLDCPYGTNLCKRLAVKYDACPDCVWTKVQDAAEAVRLAKAVICATGVTGAGVVACVPTPGAVADLIDKMATRVEAGGGDADELTAIAVAGYKAAGKDEQAAALEAVLSAPSE